MYRHYLLNKRAIDFITEFRTSSNVNNFLRKYNIILNDDGSIYDMVHKKHFPCVYNWARNICNGTNKN